MREAVSCQKQTPVNYSDWAWEMESLAVVACDGKGNGAVLWTGGPHVRHEIEEAGSVSLGDLGLDDAPLGVSVWEGKYLWFPGSWEYPQDGSTEPRGKFRAPTEEEWKSIKEGRSPWGEEAWQHVPCTFLSTEQSWGCPLHGR